MKLKVLRADPAGNITLFVLSPVEKKDYPAVANRLMALPQFAAEQVGFVHDDRMDMEAGEFCGNASRAFGMLVAREKGVTGEVQVEVSGCDHPLSVFVTEESASCEMPLPLLVRKEYVKEIPCTLVHLGGIAHLIAENVTPSEAFFTEAEPIFREMPELEAYGVIFLDGENMKPLVKVPATDTLFWEGSCGSGTLAAQIARSEGQPDGTYSGAFVQPAGIVTAEVIRRDGRIVSAKIGGPVKLDEAMEIEI